MKKMYRLYIAIGIAMIILMLLPLASAKGGGSGGRGGGTGNRGTYYGGSDYDWNEDYHEDFSVDVITSDNQTMNFEFTCNGHKYYTADAIAVIAEDYTQSYIINNTDKIEEKAIDEYEDFMSDEYYEYYSMDITKIKWQNETGVWQEKEFAPAWEIIGVILVIAVIVILRKRGEVI